MPPKPTTKAAPRAATKTTTKSNIKAANKTSSTAPAKPASKGAPAKGASGGAKSDVKTVEADMAKMAIKKPLVPMETTLKECALLPHMGGDIGEKCKESGRWMFMIDRNGNVHTFLKYRDVNMISMTSQMEFQPEPLRRALQGALKYGKPHIIDISNTDQNKALDVIKDQYNQIYEGLWEDLMSKKITEEDAISKLYRPNDDRDLQNPLDYRVADFTFLVYTNVDPPSTANESFFPVIIN